MNFETSESKHIVLFSVSLIVCAARELPVLIKLTRKSLIVHKQKHIWFSQKAILYLNTAFLYLCFLTYCAANGQKT